ncbi:glycosyltransferase family 2 protein [Gemmiger sp.]
MSKPTICVIVPVYKAMATLDRCVESILAQEVSGGLTCILVDDGSPDDSGKLCDAWAARDARVTVIHQEDKGVSGARNAGIDAADSAYIVFLDSDDALRPGALQAAVDAQNAAPSNFVVWHYTTNEHDPAAVTSDAAPRPQDALARLWLDCLLAMPWNKLYRTELAQQLKFDEQYTLGEDLQFVLDYIALLGTRTPTFGYTVLSAPLTFYDCSRGGTLSTRYHADYCKVWPEHFSKLNKACYAAHCPQDDMRPLHRAELTVYAEGVADILRRDPAKRKAVRRDKAYAALRSPWLHALLERMRIEGAYSAYYLPCRWRSIRLVWTLAEAKRTDSPLYGKLDWAGYYLLRGKLRRD